MRKSSSQLREKLKNTSKKSCPRNKLTEEDWYDVECQSLENNDIIDNGNQDESKKKAVLYCRSFQKQQTSSYKIEKQNPLFQKKEKKE